jgi:hypothetical protein
MIAAVRRAAVRGNTKEKLGALGAIVVRIRETDIVGVDRAARAGQIAGPTRLRSVTMRRQLPRTIISLAAYACLSASLQQ